MDYYPPQFKKEEFHCPHCKVYASQSWVSVYQQISLPGLGQFQKSDEFNLSICIHCKKKSYWYKEHLIDPSEAPIAQAHQDLPEDCRRDYEEAREIFTRSPRASAALLRLSVQKLLLHLGGHGKNINDDIKKLVKEGLPILVQQALDYCRVVGNNAVHPGEINVNDSPDIAASLFDMINFIVEDRIAKPREIQALYDRLPESAKDSIQKRDSTS